MGNKMTAEKGGVVDLAAAFHKQCVDTCEELHKLRMKFRWLREIHPKQLEQNLQEYHKHFMSYNEEMLYMEDTGDQQTKKLSEHYERKVAQLTQKLQEESKAKDEAMTRVSELLSQILISGNPDIADLSDPQRPTKLGEMFKATYDDEWTDAFEALTDKYKLSDSDSIDTLYNMVKVPEFLKKKAMAPQFFSFLDLPLQCNDLCLKASDLQYKQIESVIRHPVLFRKHSTTIPVGYDKTPIDDRAQMSKTMGATPSSAQPAQVVGGDSQTPSSKLEPHIKDFKKLGAIESLPVLEQAIIQELRDGKRFPADSLNNKDVLKYLKKCVHVCWLMVSQYPPMEVNFDLKVGDRFNQEWYKEYQTRGDRTAQVVWPAVLLHHKGPVVCKGYAEAERKK